MVSIQCTLCTCCRRAECKEGGRLQTKIQNCARGTWRPKQGTRKGEQSGYCMGGRKTESAARQRGPCSRVGRQVRICSDSAQNQPERGSDSLPPPELDARARICFLTRACLTCSAAHVRTCRFAARFQTSSRSSAEAKAGRYRPAPTPRWAGSRRGAEA